MITFEANLRRQKPCELNFYASFAVFFVSFSIRKQEPQLCKEKDVEIQNFYTGENRIRLQECISHENYLVFILNKGTRKKKQLTSTPASLTF